MSVQDLSRGIQWSVLVHKKSKAMQVLVNVKYILCVPVSLHQGLSDSVRQRGEMDLNFVQVLWVLLKATSSLRQIVLQAVSTSCVCMSICSELLKCLNLQMGKWQPCALTWKENPRPQGTGLDSSSEAVAVLAGNARRDAVLPDKTY